MGEVVEARGSSILDKSYKDTYGFASPSLLPDFRVEIKGGRREGEGDNFWQFLLIFLRKVDRSIDSFIYLSFWIFEWKGFCIDAVLFRIANVIEYLLQFVRENDSLHSPIHFSKFFEREKERKVRFEQCDFGANSFSPIPFLRSIADSQTLKDKSYSSSRRI